MLERRALLGAAAALLASPALAGGGSPRFLRLVIGWPPGGATDAFGRLLAPYLAEQLGTPVVIENLGGASGRLGAQAVARAQPDGHTLLLANDSFAAAEVLPVAGLPPLRDALLPVTQAAEAPNVLAVPQASPFADIAGFVAAARARPGALNLGVPGIGSAQHLTGEILLRDAGGLQAEPIGYRGGGPLATDLIAGKLDAAVFGLGAVAPLLRDGVLRALVVTTRERNAGVPAVPTVAETLVPGFHLANWQGLFAPRGTPEAVVQRLHAATAAALRDPVLRGRLDALGFLPASTPPAAFATLLDETIARFGAVVREAGIREEGA